MKEKEILRILEEDARVTPREIAVRLGMDEEDVRRTVCALEEQGAILAYKAKVDWEKAGEEMVSAIIEVHIVPERGTGFDAIAERIYRFPEVSSVFLVSGTYDLHVLVEGRTLREVANFVSERLAPLDRVEGTATHFVLKKYKESGTVMAAHQANHRQAIVP